MAAARPPWRVEHDYRELKDALGLGHFEPWSDDYEREPELQREKWARV